MSVFYDFLLQELRSAKYKWSYYNSKNLSTEELYKPRVPEKVIYVDSLQFGRITITTNNSAGAGFRISNILYKDKMYYVDVRFDKNLKIIRTDIGRDERGWKKEIGVEGYCEKIANDFFEENKEAFEQLIKQQKDELDELNQYVLTSEEKEKLGYLITLKTTITQLPKEEQDVLLANEEVFVEYLCKLLGK